MTITCVGHGYVGLVTACVFADFGNNVWVIGHTKEKIDRLKKGDPIIYEPGLEELLKKNLKAKRIIFTMDYDKAVKQSDIVFINVGTPPQATGEADLSAVFAVAESIGKNLKDGFTVVSCKSTVPVGTNKRVEEVINKVKPKNAEFAMASCPEFLREGTAIYDTVNPDRVVIGSESQKAIDLLVELHQPLNSKNVITDLSSAELIKYTANAMLATKISFANLISLYCEKTGADVENVLDAVGLDKRIGRIFMDPGIGYGGSCFPKDVKALTEIGRMLGIDVGLLQNVTTVNKNVQDNFVQRILSNVKGKKIAVWGLAFKANTDDVREASSHYIIKKLLENGYEVTAYDPAAMETTKKVLGDKIKYGKDVYDVVQKADALLVLTEWHEFMQSDLEKVKSLMRTPIIFDGRNIYEPENLKELGFTYYSVGRRDVNHTS